VVCENPMGLGVVKVWEIPNVDVFGTPSIVSEVLSGKRELNKDYIKGLSERFHVSPELFF
jgi:antitoxin component HigA of HigAB toxin-antitoxin module